jgi:hypothetical protein
MASKYEVLAKLIERDGELHNLDQAGNYHLLANIAREIGHPYSDVDDLVDALYELLSDVFAGEDATPRPTPALPPQSVPRDPSEGPSTRDVGF